MGMRTGAPLRILCAIHSQHSIDSARCEWRAGRLRQGRRGVAQALSDEVLALQRMLDGSPREEAVVAAEVAEDGTHGPEGDDDGGGGGGGAQDEEGAAAAAAALQVPHSVGPQWTVRARPSSVRRAAGLTAGGGQAAAALAAVERSLSAALAVAAKAPPPPAARAPLPAPPAAPAGAAGLGEQAAAPQVLRPGTMPRYCAAVLLWPAWPRGADS